jgi:hypothetical protein
MDIGNSVVRARAVAVALAGSFAATALAAAPATSMSAAVDSYGSPITIGTNAKAEYVLATARPSVRISTRTSTVTARGKAPIAVICPVGAPGPCRGTITIGLSSRTRGGRASRSLGSTRYEAPKGRRARVRIHLDSHARRRLVRSKTLRVTVTATTVWSGHTATTVRGIVIKAHPRR